MIGSSFSGCRLESLFCFFVICSLDSDICVHIVYRSLKLKKIHNCVTLSTISSIDLQVSNINSCFNFIQNIVIKHLNLFSDKFSSNNSLLPEQIILLILVYDLLLLRSLFSLINVHDLLFLSSSYFSRIACDLFPSFLFSFQLLYRSIVAIPFSHVFELPTHPPPPTQKKKISVVSPYF